MKAKKFKFWLKFATWQTITSGWDYGLDKVGPQIFQKLKKMYEMRSGERGSGYRTGLPLGRKLSKTQLAWILFEYLVQDNDGLVFEISLSVSGSPIWFGPNEKALVELAKFKSDHGRLWPSAGSLRWTRALRFLEKLGLISQKVVGCGAELLCTASGLHYWLLASSWLKMETLWFAHQILAGQKMESNELSELMTSLLVKTGILVVNEGWIFIHPAISRHLDFPSWNRWEALTLVQRMFVLWAKPCWTNDPQIRTLIEHLDLRDRDTVIRSREPED